MTSQAINKGKLYTNNTTGYKYRLEAKVGNDVLLRPAQTYSPEIPEGRLFRVDFDLFRSTYTLG